MRVSMLTPISGTRNGVAWPPVGGVTNLPAEEAADMIANGYAEPAEPAGPATETADADPVGEVTDAAPAKPARKPRKAPAKKATA